jgi:hypothetical protein
MCEHRNITYEFHVRPVCSDCGISLVSNPRGKKFCAHTHAVLVRVLPDPDKQDGVINPSQARFLIHCPDCGNFIDYIQHNADVDDDDIPF